MSICVIPARGGSKRIPKKNIKKFIGKPIIAYPIQAAIASGCFSNIIVSTDSIEIARVAERYGAEVPSIRSSDNSTDDSTLHDVAVECIDMFILNESSAYMTMILPTAALLTPESIYDFVSFYKDDAYDSHLAVVEYEVSPDKALLIESQGFLSKVNRQKLRLRSQDMETFYHDAGQMYGFRMSEVIKRKSLIGDKCKPYVVSKYRSQDIDEMYDWDMAELKYELLRGKNA